MLSDGKRTAVQFMLFSLVGLSNTVISLGVYSLCIFLGVNYLVSNVLGFIIGVLNAFFWNNRFVFKAEEGCRNVWHSLLKTYCSYGITGLLLNSLLLFVFIDKLGISKYLAQVFCIVINLPINFALNKFWSFSAKGRK